MPSPSTFSTSDFKKRLAQTLIDRVAPTHFITLSLCPNRQIAGVNGGQTFVRGDDVIYCETYMSFVRALSKRVTDKQRWKRHKQLLRSACAIEGGMHDKEFHLHLIIAFPDHIEETAMSELVTQTAEGNPWIKDGRYGCDIERIKNAYDVARYCMKEGTDRLIYT